jgi:hypothetical protein
LGADPFVFGTVCITNADIAGVTIAGGDAVSELAEPLPLSTLFTSREAQLVG